MFTPQKNAWQAALTTPSNYVVYGWQRSYFTHKLMAALDFYNADWVFVPKTADNSDEIRFRSGTHQIPVLHTPENWMIADTTPLLQMLDGRFPERRMFPDGEVGGLVHVLEEYFDEWIARTTVHWRWNYEENHQLLAMDAAHGDPVAAATLINWGAKVCRATGVDSVCQQQAAEDEYHRIMAAAEDQLAETPFLLGGLPTALDCIVLAGLRAHFLFDPAPKRALEHAYPRVINWVKQATSWPTEGDLCTPDNPTGFARFVLNEMAATYQQFALANKAALEAGEKAFVIPMYGEEVSYLARPYIEQSRQMLALHLRKLGVGSNSLALDTLLANHKLTDLIA